MSLTLRIATPEDHELLASMRLQFATEIAGPQSEENVSLLHQQLTDYFRLATVESQIISVIAEVNGIVAGIGSVHLRNMPGNFRNVSGRWGYIMNMFTLPAYRRMGIGTAILERLREAGQQAGIHAFELHATEAGLPVYLNAGFQLHTEPTLRSFYKKNQ